MDILSALHTVAYPRGVYSARVDDKGRLKLPTDFQHYLLALGETKVFITSLDERIARIYPISIWKANEKILRTSTDSEAADDLSFTANDLGSDGEMDSQGRLTLKTELRQTLGLGNQQVFLEHSRGHIKFYNEQVHEERRARARENRAVKLKALEDQGLL